MGKLFQRFYLSMAINGFVRGRTAPSARCFRLFFDGEVELSAIQRV